jgi:hypothetical protein
MSTSPLPAPPSSLFLNWVVSSPEQVAAYLSALHSLGALEITVSQAGQTFRCPVKFGTENAVITLPSPPKFRNSWVAASGTANRSSFTTSTVTTAQLAERVKALIDDLQSIDIAPRT